jgi:hypothetical protein
MAQQGPKREGLAESEGVATPTDEDKRSCEGATLQWPHLQARRLMETKRRTTKPHFHGN